MGTRHLIVVVHEGEHRIAQYGQWDGYPSGQGTNILAFCKEKLSSAEDKELFRRSVARCSFVTHYDEKWSDRGAGADILSMVAECGPDEEPTLNDSYEFAGDSLFCEWAYVIDLDSNLLEVYKGFNKQPLDPFDRFHDVKHDNGYYPVRIKAKYSLNDLPDERKFLDECEPEDDDDDN